jgi:hypothetical protein
MQSFFTAFERLLELSAVVRQCASDRGSDKITTIKVFGENGVQLRTAEVFAIPSVQSNGQ